MALAPLMAHQPSARFMENHQTQTTIFSSHHHHHPSSCIAAVPALQLSFPPRSSSVESVLSDSDVAAAQHLLHLSSEADVDAVSLNFGNHPAKPIVTTREISKGEDSNAAAPAQTRRKRRFASIADIYARTKPLKAPNVSDPSSCLPLPPRPPA